MVLIYKSRDEKREPLDDLSHCDSHNANGVEALHN